MHIPVGTGNTELLIRAIESLKPEAVVLTPSYAAYLAENHDLRSSSVERVLVAGEPGGGEPAFRAKLEAGWGAKVTEAMGVGDIGPSLWGECEQQDGMHLGAHGFVHPELIDPETRRGAADGGRRGRRARPHASAASGRSASALPHARPRRGPDEPVPVRADGTRESAASAEPTTCSSSAASTCSRRRSGKSSPSSRRRISGHILVRPQSAGVKQEPPLPVSVELARDASADDELAETIRAKLREALTVQMRVELVPWGSLSRSEYKSKLVER